jgi:hypothetical protein
MGDACEPGEEKIKLDVDMEPTAEVFLWAPKEKNLAAIMMVLMSLLSLRLISVVVFCCYPHL